MEEIDLQKKPIIIHHVTFLACEAKSLHGMFRPRQGRQKAADDAVSIFFLSNPSIRENFPLYRSKHTCMGNVYKWSNGELTSLSLFFHYLLFLPNILLDWSISV
jgi:hypothetical protein